MKVKDWTKVIELPYRIDYASKKHGYKKTLGTSDVVVTVIRKRLEFFGSKDWDGNKWEVTLRTYHSAPISGNQYQTLAVLNSKNESLDFAKDVMKNIGEYL